VLRHGDGGWICEPGDIAGLARLMREAAQAAGNATAGAAARATAEGYGIDDMARKLTQLYASLA
jgi:glycosyltransferase involved in cell wall biosynthesis